jgi:RimJ/RimL family protein N-acetyltransferase
VKTEIRPTIPDDLQYVIGEPLPFRVRCLTVLIDGRVVGVGGLGFPARGSPIAFVQQAREAKKYPVAFHKAGHAAVRMFRESGVNEVLATADAYNPAALAWLTRLGFRRQREIGDRVLFVWRRGV